MARRATRRAAAPATTEAAPAPEVTKEASASEAFDALMADLNDDGEAEAAELAVLEKEFEATVPASTDPEPTGEPVQEQELQQNPDPDGNPPSTETPQPAEPEVLTGEVLEADDLSHLPKSTRIEIEAGRKALKKFAASRAAE